MSNKDLHKKIDRLLHAQRIYHLDAYGWLNADDHDPAHVGHAMAQTAALWCDVVDTLHEDNSKHIPLKGWQKALMVAQGDFEGLMEASRLATGSMLLHEVDEELRSTHFMSSMLLLSAATDRLRDFFICAVFRKVPGKWQAAEAAKTSDYAQPFIEALIRSIPNNAARNAAQILPAFAKQLSSFRKKRNVIAHRIATAEGRRKDRLARRKPTKVNYDIDWSQVDWSKVIDPEFEDRQMARALSAEPVAWYKALIEASNLIFVVEYHLRTAARGRLGKATVGERC